MIVDLDSLANNPSFPKFDMLPIAEADLLDFKRWIDWNGSVGSADGFDFVAYERNEGDNLLGLPIKTRVVAVADGVVLSIFKRRYGSTITIRHGSPHSGYLSVYQNTNPSERFYQLNPEVENHVKKGEELGTLFKDSELGGMNLSHLHFSAYYPKDKQIEPVPILYLFPHLAGLEADPRGVRNFTVRVRKY